MRCCLLSSGYMWGDTGDLDLVPAAQSSSRKRRCGNFPGGNWRASDYPGNSALGLKRQCWQSLDDPGGSVFGTGCLCGYRPSLSRDTGILDLPQTLGFHKFIKSEIIGAELGLVELGFYSCGIAWLYVFARTIASSIFVYQSVWMISSRFVWDYGLLFVQILEWKWHCIWNLWMVSELSHIAWGVAICELIYVWRENAWLMGKGCY